MRSLAQDLRFAARMLAKSPGTTLAVVVSLALAVGANTTIFTWASAVFVEPLPRVADVDRLLVVHQTDPNQGVVSFSYPDYRDFRDRTQTLAGLAVTRQVLTSLGPEGRPERVYAQLVSGNFFEVLCVRPALGRGFAPEEDRVPGERPVVVLSHALWQRSFGGDPGIVGRVIQVNARPFTVIGVAPAGFHGSMLGLRFEAWVPMMMQQAVEPGGSRLEARGNRWLEAFGRLRPTVDRRTAEAELAGIREQISAEHPDDAVAGRGVAVFPVNRAPRSGASVLGPIMVALASVVGLVLLIACANVANLLLARAVARRREMAVRLSLGARRSDLVRQLLVESVTLSLLGGAAGLALASFGDHVLRALIPPTNFPIGLTVTLDSRALLVTLAVCVATGVLFGLAPALAAGRDVAPALRAESGTVAGAHGRSRLRHALVVVQVAVSFVLLVVAGLFLRSLQSIGSQDLGFRAQGALLGSVELFTSGYDRERGLAFYRSVLERASSLPGVGVASLARRIPLGLGGTSSSSLQVEGFTAPEADPAWGYYNTVGPAFFGAMGTTLVAGREFSGADDTGAPLVLVVNETMARRYWSDGSPVGRRVRFGEDWLTVIGVARDTPYREIGGAAGPWFYVPILQHYRPDATVVLRTDGDPRALARPLVAAFADLDRNIAVFGVRTLEEHVSASSFRQRLGSQVLGAFGALGLVLAAVGLYGVLAYAVGQRRPEIGVRVALGARPQDVFRMVFGEGMRLMAAGCGLGLLAALGASRLLRSLLFGTGPADATTFAGVVALLVSVAAIACSIPARHATRVDPITTLRTE